MTQNKCTEITFQSGPYNLKGVLHLPGTENPPFIVGSHGLESNGDSPKQIELAHRCNSMGFAYFRFDHRGCGRSEGIFAEVTSVENRTEDLINAVNIIKKRRDTGKRYALFGSSMGGTTCIAAAANLTPEGFVVIAAPVFGNSLIKPPEELSDTPGLSLSFYKEFLKFDISPTLPLLKNILIFHGDNDDIVPFMNGKAIYEAAAEPKKLIIQKGGDHRISDPKHQKEFMNQASDWFQKIFSGKD